MQFRDLLDAVPDSVYICSKAEEDRGIRSLYANSKLNSFFKTDVLRFA